MEVAEKDAPMLQGPASLHSREPGDAHDSGDFVVISDNPATNGYDEAADLFGSLSQADAVAQVRDLIQQRDDLRKHFTACTKDLDSVNAVCQDLILQEKRLCEQAKAKIDELNEELTLYKTENARLTQQLSAHPAAAAAASSDQVPVVPLVESTDVTHPQTTVESPSDAIFSGVSIAMDTHIPSASLGESEAIEQLHGQLVRFQDHTAQLEQQMKDVQRDADAKIKNMEAERLKAVRQTTTMSTHFSNYRMQKEQEEAQLKEQLYNAKAEVADLEQRLLREEDGLREANSNYEQLMEENERTTKAILTPLRHKVAGLEKDLRAAQRAYEEVETRRRGMEENCAALQSDCRKKAERIDEVKMQSQRECQRLEASCRDLESVLEAQRSECERKSEMIETLRKEKSSAEYRFEEARVDKRKADDLISVLRSNIKESANRLAAMAALQTENRQLKQANSDYLRKIDELNQRIEEFNRNVGDEVPDLIRKRDAIKKQLKDEQEKSDKLRDEIRHLQAKITKADTLAVRQEKKNDQQNKIITDLKQKNANLEGQVLRLQNEIGELNSRNVTDVRGGQGTLYGDTRPKYEGVYHERPTMTSQREAPQTENPMPHEIIKCIFEGCMQSGDEEYMNNHIARDHPDVVE